MGCAWAITGARWKERAGEHVAETCEAVQRQLLSIALSSISMFASGKEQGGTHRLNCIFLCVSYLEEKSITHHTNMVPFLHCHQAHGYGLLTADCSQTQSTKFRMKWHFFAWNKTNKQNNYRSLASEYNRKSKQRQNSTFHFLELKHLCKAVSELVPPPFQKENKAFWSSQSPWQN